MELSAFTGSIPPETNNLSIFFQVFIGKFFDAYLGCCYEKSLKPEYEKKIAFLQQNFNLLIFLENKKKFNFNIEEYNFNLLSNF